MQVISRDVPGSFTENFQKSLQQMVQMKLGKMQQRQEATKLGKAFESLIPGINPKQAQALADMPPETRKSFIDQGFLPLLQSIGNKQIDQQSMQQPDQQQEITQQRQPFQMQDYAAQVDTSPASVFHRMMSGGMSPQQEQGVFGGMGGQQQPQPMQQQPQPMQQQAQQQQVPLFLTNQQRAAMAKQKQEDVKQQRVLAKEARVQAHKEQVYLDAKYKDYNEKLDTLGGVAAKENLTVLKKINRLNESDKLTPSNIYLQAKRLEEHGKSIGAGVGGAAGTLLGGIIGGIGGSVLPGVGTAVGAGVGAGIGGSTGAGLGTAAGALYATKFVGSAEDQEFTKLTMHFLKNLKAIFGGRISNDEMNRYIDSIPNLSQNKKGRRSVIKDLKLLGKAWIYRKEVRDKLVKANGDHSPINLEQRVEEAARPYLDILKQKFLKV